MSQRDVFPFPADSKLVNKPAYRSLRIYAFDPSLDLHLDLAVVNQVIAKIRWEDVGPGPVGEYIEVVDVDPTVRKAYAAVDLNHLSLASQDGLAPSEGNPLFHQQMVYAVSMLTIQAFERALGRKALWSSRESDRKQRNSEYVQRLRIYPHALREPNAFYDPKRKALLFGYFYASKENPGLNLPGGRVFTCLSFDVIAHETTHALLDGVNKRYAENSNPDVLAFHEAFSDIVALLMRFTFPEILRHEIARQRGSFRQGTFLGQLAWQFGQAIGLYGSLRDAIGHINAKGEWELKVPDPRDLDQATKAHERGAVLVAAVFDAFITIYEQRTADLVRIATNGSGVLQAGALHPDLVGRLADEAAKAAQHVLTICIRALDYCPPVDITFGEYLRAMITIDSDLMAVDTRGYRLAIIEAFRRRGIYPTNVPTLSVESLRWRSIEDETLDRALKDPLRTLERIWMARGDQNFANLRQEFGRVGLNSAPDWKALGGTSTQKDYGDEIPYLSKNRERIFQLMSVSQRYLMKAIKQSMEDPKIARLLGVEQGRRVQITQVRPARRVLEGGSTRDEFLITIQQRLEYPRQTDDIAATTPFGERSITDVRHGTPPDRWVFRGGSTLVIDMDTWTIRYAIVKSVHSKERLKAQHAYQQLRDEGSLALTYGFEERTRAGRNPFAMLHRGDD